MYRGGQSKVRLRLKNLRLNSLAQKAYSLRMRNEEWVSVTNHPKMTLWLRPCL